MHWEWSNLILTKQINCRSNIKKDIHNEDCTEMVWWWRHTQVYSPFFMLADWLKHDQIFSISVDFYPHFFQRCLCILCILSKRSLDFAVWSQSGHADFLWWPCFPVCLFLQGLCFLSLYVVKLPVGFYLKRRTVHSKHRLHYNVFPGNQSPLLDPFSWATETSTHMFRLIVILVKPIRENSSFSSPKVACVKTIDCLNRLQVQC